MNTYIKSIIIAALVLISQVTYAQDKDVKKKEINFEVAGKCDMCKTRIENALDIKGVKFAEWSVETHQCKIIFNPQKISEDDIHKTLSELGHDTDKLKANEEAYENLHGCCHYDRMGEDSHEH